MAENEWAGREAMMRHSSTRNMPVTWKGDILPMVLSSLGAQPENYGAKTTTNLLKTIYDINKDGTVQLYQITGDRYKRNLQVVFKSDLIINTCHSIHERPLGACINLHFVEDVKRTASVLKKVSYIAPRVPRPKRMGSMSTRPFKHNIERLFEPFSFDSEIDIPESIYEELVRGMMQLQKHAQDQMNLDPKHTYVKRLKEELTKDVSCLLNNSQNQMRRGVVNVHLTHMATNSASVDMLSTWDEVGTAGEECWLSNTLDILVQKQLEQFLVKDEGHASAIQNIVKVFDHHTSTPTANAGLQVTVHKDGREMDIAGVVVISGTTSLNIPTVQMQATYNRNVRAFELKNEDYNADKLMVEPNIARDAFPNYSMDDRVIVKEHKRNVVPTSDPEETASRTSIKGNVTLLRKELPDGVLLLDNVSSVYIVDQDRDLDPLTSVLTHTTQCMWNMLHGFRHMGNTSGDFQKSDQMSHIYMDATTVDLYLNPTGKARQKISSCMLKDAVFNDPYIYSPYFADCFNNMYRAAMKLTHANPTRSLFTKCKRTAEKVYEDAHAWHAMYKRSQGCFTSAGNGDIIMSELHPYFDALPDAEGLKAYNRLVHGNIPLYIRPPAAVLVAGQTLAENIWGHKSYKEFRADFDHAKILARELNGFFTEIVPKQDQAAVHMLYSIEHSTLPKVNDSLTEEVIEMYKACPASLILGFCALPFIYNGSVPKDAQYKWKDKASGLIVRLDVPQVDKSKYTEEPPSTRFFHALGSEDRTGAVTFSYMVRPPFHELMKEIRASADCFAVKMCAMFCAWTRLTAEGTDFAFNYTRWPLAATVLTFKQDSTKHVLISRPNSIISLADMPTTEIKREDGKITIESTAHHRMACDGINPNSVIALHTMGSSRTQRFDMTVSTPPTQMKDNIKLTDSDAFRAYKKLCDKSLDANRRKRTKTGKNAISLAGEQLAWPCPPVVPSSVFQRPTNPTGRSSLPRMSDTSCVDASVEMHDPTRDNGTGISTLNPYATLPGGYVFCLHADPNGKVGEVNNCTYKNSRGTSRAAHFFSPPQLLATDKTRASSCLAKKITNLPCSRRVLGDQDKFPTFIEADCCNSFMSNWSETTGLAQHEPHSSNSFIYDNMISNRQSDSTYASREVVWCNHHYAVPGHTFYAKNKTFANKVVSSA